LKIINEVTLSELVTKYNEFETGSVWTKFKLTMLC